MNDKAKKISGIAVAILAGACAFVRTYNAGNVKGYMEGRAKGLNEGFESGWHVGWNDAVCSYIATCGDENGMENAKKHYEAKTLK